MLQYVMKCYMYSVYTQVGKLMPVSIVQCSVHTGNCTHVLTVYYECCDYIPWHFPDPRVCSVTAPFTPSLVSRHFTEELTVVPSLPLSLSLCLHILLINTVLVCVMNPLHDHQLKVSPLVISIVCVCNVILSFCDHTLHSLSFLVLLFGIWSLHSCSTL